MFGQNVPPQPRPQLNPAVLAAFASLLNSRQPMLPGHLPEQPAPGLSPLAQAAAGNDPAGAYTPPPGMVGQVAAGTIPQAAGGGMQLQQLLQQFRQQHRGFRAG